MEKMRNGVYKRHSLYFYKIFKLFYWRSLMRNSLFRTWRKSFKLTPTSAFEQKANHWQFLSLSKPYKKKNTHHKCIHFTKIQNPKKDANSYIWYLYQLPFFFVSDQTINRLITSAPFIKLTIMWSISDNMCNLYPSRNLGSYFNPHVYPLRCSRRLKQWFLLLKQWHKKPQPAIWNVPLQVPGPFALLTYTVAVA